MLALLGLLLLLPLLLFLGLSFLLLGISGLLLLGLFPGLLLGLLPLESLQRSEEELAGLLAVHVAEVLAGVLVGVLAAAGAGQDDLPHLLPLDSNILLPHGWLGSRGFSLVLVLGSTGLENWLGG